MSEYVSLLEKFQAKAQARLEQFRARMRVKIAQDVLATMKGMRIDKGAFVKPDDPWELPKDDSKAAARRLQKNKTCRVCALGACFLSVIKLDNKFLGSWRDLIRAGEEISDRLGDFFDMDQLKLIENAFELGRGWFTSDGSVNRLEGLDVTRAVQFGERYDKDENRLKAIMKNIIKNGGTFKP